MAVEDPAGVHRGDSGEGILARRRGMSEQPFQRLGVSVLRDRLACAHVPLVVGGVPVHGTVPVLEVAASTCPVGLRWLRSLRRDALVLVVLGVEGRRVHARPFRLKRGHEVRVRVGCRLMLSETQREAVVGSLPGVLLAARRQARLLPENVRDDAVADAVLAVCEAVSRYEVARGPWQAYANCVARGSVIDYARVFLGRQQSKVHGQLELDLRAAETSFESRELLRSVMRLPRSQRVCLVHGAAFGARTLGISVPAAQSRRYRALEALRVGG